MAEREERQRRSAQGGDAQRADRRSTADPGPEVILASGSPRRRELLRAIGVEPVVQPADVDETPGRGEAAAALVTRLAAAKAEAVPAGDDSLVIAADTVVVLEGDILGKPTDADDARAMLRRLSGRTHEVVTGVHVRRGDRRASAVEVSEVRFRRLTSDEIDAYVATGEPLDKAGAYAIQGGAGAFVEGLTGSRTNVIGLPTAAVVGLADGLDAPLVDVRFPVVDPRNDDARGAVASYVAELDQRFPGGFDPGSGTEDLAGLAAPAGVFVVVRGNGLVAGCGGVQRLDDRTGEIKRMWVAPDFRGLGIARRLLGELEDHARRLGHRRVVLDTNATLTEAIALYEGAGYAAIEPYNDNPDAQRWYGKEL